MAMLLLPAVCFAGQQLRLFVAVVSTKGFNNNKYSKDENITKANQGTKS